MVASPSDITIKHRHTSAVLWSGVAVDMADAVKCALAAGANLHGANLRVADLYGADLYGADLHGADLYGADLYGADLHGANLRGANLYGANLYGADLYGANLHGANLRGANLYGANLYGANFDSATIMPGGETWQVYLEDVVSALLICGGKSLVFVVNESQWLAGTSWANSPIGVAFGAESIDLVPALFKPRVREFWAFFSAGLIPKPAVATPPTSRDVHKETQLRGIILEDNDEVAGYWPPAGR